MVQIKSLKWFKLRLKS